MERSEKMWVFVYKYLRKFYYFCVINEQLMNQKAHTSLKTMIRLIAMVMLLAFLQNNIFNSYILSADDNLIELVDLNDDSEEDGEDKDEKEEKEERFLRLDDMMNGQHQFEINYFNEQGVFNYLFSSSLIHLDIGTPPPEYAMS